MFHELMVLKETEHRVQTAWKEEISAISKINCGGPA